MLCTNDLANSHFFGINIIFLKLIKYNNKISHITHIIHVYINIFFTVVKLY